MTDPRRLDPFFVALAWWPVAWHSAGAVLVWLAPAGWRIGIAAVWALLLPPLLCRMLRPLAIAGSWRPNSVAARSWWWQQQLQIPFARLPAIEEAMRLVPGLYQMWLRLWGAQVSLRCAVAAGVQLTDRQWVRIGSGAILGNGCMLGGHLVLRDADGWLIIIAPVTIGTRAIAGARTMIGPGASIADDEAMPATYALPPFQRWQGGRRIKAPGDA